MQIRIYPQPDGTSRIYIKRTRAKEGRSRLIEGVTPESFRETLAREVRRIRGELPPGGSEAS